MGEPVVDRFVDVWGTSLVDGGLDDPEDFGRGLVDLGSTFFLPKPNRLRFFDFESVLGELLSSIFFSLDSVIVELESPFVV